MTAIVEAVRNALERCPPELSADLVDRGFVMAGGSSLLRGIDRLLSDKTGLPVTVADDPLSAGGFGPNDATIRVRPGPVRTTLIRPRTSFVPEMLKSVENL